MNDTNDKPLEPQPPEEPCAPPPATGSEAMPPAPVEEHPVEQQPVEAVAEVLAPTPPPSVMTDPFAARFAEAAPVFRVKPAGFWIRAVAIILDSLLFGFVCEPIIRIFALPFSGLFAEYAEYDDVESIERIVHQMMQGDVLPLLNLLLVSLLLTTIGFLLNTLFFGYFHYVSGQTPGKRACGIRVVDSQTLGYLTLGQSFWRYAAQSLNYCTCMIGFIMAGFTEEKKALHDYLAHTRVAYSDKVPMAAGEKLFVGFLVLMAVATLFIDWLLWVISIFQS